jgi:hypothetical protein
MNFFCLLWVPLFYLFWRSMNEDSTETNPFWALVLGGIVALGQNYAGFLITPDEFGFMRWLHCLIDIIALPALVPIIIALILGSIHHKQDSVAITNFALLFIIPNAALRSVSRNVLQEPVGLLCVPLLWTALAMAIPFFIRPLLKRCNIFTVSIGCLGFIALPLLAGSSYWALFCQDTVRGMALLGITFVPVIFAVVIK